VKVDFDGFRRAWDTVARTLALQFAASMGINLTIQDENVRESFLRTFGLDSNDFNETDYIMAGLSMHVDNLEKTFVTFTKNMDWIDKHEDLGLDRGVEMA